MQDCYINDFEQIARVELGDTWYKRLKNKIRCIEIYWLYLDQGGKMKKKIMYGLRWQAAFVIYYLCVKCWGELWGTITAGIIGAIICYRIDQKLTNRGGKI